MSNFQKIKRAAAFLLLVAAFLPLSQCSRNGDDKVPPAPKSLSQAAFPRSNDQFSYTYAISAVDLTGFGAITAFAFVWPLIFLLLGRKFWESRFCWIVNALEVLLCGGTIYWLYVLTAFGHLLYGAYVAFFAVLTYGCCALVPLFYAIRALVHRRNRQPERLIQDPVE